LRVLGKITLPSLGVFCKDFVVSFTARSKDRAEGKHCPPLFVQSGDSWSSARVRVFLFQTTRLVRTQLVYRIALVAGCTRELRSLLYRIALLFTERHHLGILPVGAACHLGPTGVPQECIRTRDCTRDIENFAASHPKATVIDWGHFREGWEAGEKWSRYNQCSCTSANSVL